MTTNSSDSCKTVGQLVSERPARGRVFERLGIDYCCGGRKSLQEACTQRGLNVRVVQTELDAADAEPWRGGDRDWRAASLSDLAEHIRTTHHELMRKELPRVGELLRKVARVHAQAHPELGEVARTFDAFAQELISHMMKEDTVLFPWIRAIKAGGGCNHQCAMSLEQPIRKMMQEHDDAARDLAKMRELTNGFTPPPEACGTYRVMLSGLQDIEADMHTHVHKENNILFPRAIEEVSRGPAAK